jgi:hypothetical protein
MGGLGQGARSEQSAQAAAQDIKFKSFDDQVRAANLHHQDQELQLRTQDQTDAHQKFQDFQHDWNQDHGIDDTTIPNTGDAVLDHLSTQTAGNGAASIPPGTHLSADGKSIQVPTDTQATRDGQLQQYNTFAPVYGLPSLPEGAKFVPPKLMDALTHTQQGYGVDGTPINHDILPQKIAALQSQRAAIAAKGGSSDDQLKALDGTLGILQANQKALDDHAAGVKQQSKQAELDAENSPQSITGAAKKAGAIANAELPAKQALQDNAAGNKAANAKPDAQMYVGTDATGNQIAGTGDDLKAAGASGVTKLGADQSNKVITARQLVSPEGLFAQVKQDMLNLDAKGKMGSAATSRFNDAMLSKAGSDPDYAPLFVHTHLLATALMQAHVGSRGSENMMDEFKSLASAGKMSAPTLRSALGAEYNYVKEKAMLPKKQASQANGGGQ